MCAFAAVGDPFHGEVNSTDAHSGVNVSLYKSAPTVPIVARTVTATEYVVVTDVIFISTAGGTYELVFYPTGGAIPAAGAARDGLRIVKGNAEVLGGLAHHFETPITGPKGYSVALIAAAGQVDLIITGGICEG
jgi:hypothetical protein